MKTIFACQSDNAKLAFQLNASGPAVISAIVEIAGTYALALNEGEQIFPRVKVIVPRNNPTIVGCKLTKATTNEEIRDTWTLYLREGEIDYFLTDMVTPTDREALFIMGKLLEFGDTLEFFLQKEEDKWVSISYKVTVVTMEGLAGLLKEKFHVYGDLRVGMEPW